MTAGVTEFAAGFELNEEERGISVTQIFNYDPDDLIDHGVAVPEIGSVFELPHLLTSAPIDNIGTWGYTSIRCRKRSWYPIEGDARKIKWVCNFTNEPVDAGIFIASGEDYVPSDPSDLPINFEYSGEFATIQPVTNSTKAWKWTSDGKDVVQAIPHKICSATARMLRYVPDVNYETFSYNVKFLRGRVNDIADTPLCLAGGEGCWLFTGCTTEVLNNWKDEKWWRAELTFSYRDPDGTDNEGWNKLLRSDSTTNNGEWGTVQNPYAGADEDTTYYHGNFLALFDEEEDPEPAD